MGYDSPYWPLYESGLAAIDPSSVKTQPLEFADPSNSGSWPIEFTAETSGNIGIIDFSFSLTQSSIIANRDVISNVFDSLGALCYVSEPNTEEKSNSLHKFTVNGFTSTYRNASGGWIYDTNGTFGVIDDASKGTLETYLHNFNFAAFDEKITGLGWIWYGGGDDLPDEKQGPLLQYLNNDFYYSTAFSRDPLNFVKALNSWAPVALTQLQGLSENAAVLISGGISLGILQAKREADEAGQAFDTSLFTSPVALALSDPNAVREVLDTINMIFNTLGDIPGSNMQQDDVDFCTQLFSGEEFEYLVNIFGIINDGSVAPLESLNKFLKVWNPLYGVNGIYTDGTKLDLSGLTIGEVDASKVSELEKSYLVQYGGEDEYVLNPYTVNGEKIALFYGTDTFINAYLNARTNTEISDASSIYPTPPIDSDTNEPFPFSDVVYRQRGDLWYDVGPEGGDLFEYPSSAYGLELSKILLYNSKNSDLIVDICFNIPHLYDIDPETYVPTVDTDASSVSFGMTIVGDGQLLQYPQFFFTLPVDASYHNLRLDSSGLYVDNVKKLDGLSSMVDPTYAATALGAFADFGSVVLEPHKSMVFNFDISGTNITGAEKFDPISIPALTYKYIYSVQGLTTLTRGGGGVGKPAPSLGRFLYASAQNPGGFGAFDPTNTLSLLAAGFLLAGYFDLKATTSTPFLWEFDYASEGTCEVFFTWVKFGPNGRDGGADGEWTILRQVSTTVHSTLAPPGDGATAPDVQRTRKTLYVDGFAEEADTIILSQGTPGVFMRSDQFTISQISAFDSANNVNLDLTDSVFTDNSGLRTLMTELIGEDLIQDITLGDINASSYWSVYENNWDYLSGFVKKMNSSTGTNNDMSTLSLESEHVWVSMNTEYFLARNLLSQTKQEGMVLTDGISNVQALPTDVSSNLESVARDKVGYTLNKLFNRPHTLPPITAAFPAYESIISKLELKHTEILADQKAQLDKSLTLPSNYENPAWTMAKLIQNLQPQRYDSSLVCLPATLSNMDLSGMTNQEKLHQIFSLNPFYSVPLESGDKIAIGLSFEEIPKEAHGYNNVDIPARSYKFNLTLQKPTPNPSLRPENTTTTERVNVMTKYKAEFVNLFGTTAIAAGAPYDVSFVTGVAELVFPPLNSNYVPEDVPGEGHATKVSVEVAEQTIDLEYETEVWDVGIDVPIMTEDNLWEGIKASWVLGVSVILNTYPNFKLSLPATVTNQLAYNSAKLTETCSAGNLITASFPN